MKIIGTQWFITDEQSCVGIVLGKTPIGDLISLGMIGFVRNKEHCGEDRSHCYPEGQDDDQQPAIECSEHRLTLVWKRFGKLVADTPDGQEQLRAGLIPLYFFP